MVVNNVLWQLSGRRSCLRRGCSAIKWWYELVVGRCTVQYRQRVLIGWNLIQDRRLGVVFIWKFEIYSGGKKAGRRGRESILMYLDMSKTRELERRV